MCDVPIYTKKGYVPCGRCADCIGTKRQDWNMRLYWEAYYSVLTLFVTLTISDENLVYGSDDEPILIYSDVVKYFKKLRKEGLNFKYFYCGEYGEKSNRPHYHVLFFFDRDLLLNETKLLEEKWKLGNITIYLASEAMLKYCTKDMLKEIDSFYHMPKQLRPRVFASKHLGVEYVNQFKNWHSSEIIDRCKIAKNGRSYGMPRYFREKIFNKDERDIQRTFNETNRRKYFTIAQIKDREFVQEMEHQKKIEEHSQRRKLKSILKINHFNKKL